MLITYGMSQSILFYLILYQQSLTGIEDLCTVNLEKMQKSPSSTNINITAIQKQLCNINMELLSEDLMSFASQLTLPWTNMVK